MYNETIPLLREECMKKAIQERISVRSYEKRPLSEQDKLLVQDILQEIEQQTGPFGHTVRFFFVDNGTTRNTTIGTYGFIKNPPSFIGGVVQHTTEGMIDFGFLMEQVILRLTKHGLGTVWLGGTYHRRDFDVDIEEGTIIAAVSPVGYPTKQSLRERMIRKASKGDTRKPFDTLFFQGAELGTIGQDHIYYPYLQSIHIAPSASNKQPWRVVVIDDTFHIYLERTKNYGSSLSFDIQAIDIGIALSHLYLTVLEDGHQPKLEVNNRQLNVTWEYMISVSIG
jgi:nitroreductase